MPAASRTLLAFCVLALGACQRIPLYGSPVSEGPRAPPASLYHVDWWTAALVTAPPFEYAPRENASPAIDAPNGEPQRLIVLTRDGRVHALSALTGKPEWTFATGNKFNAGATVIDGVAYVPGGDGVLYALRSATGELIWKYDTREELGTQPVLADDRVVVMSENDTVFAVNAKTGKWAWQYRRDPPSGFTIRGEARPFVQGDTVYAGFADGHLVALKLADGAVRWERALSSGGQFLDVDTSPVPGPAGTLIAASYKDGLFSMDASTGTVKWNTAVGGLTSVIAIRDIVFGAGADHVSAFVSDDGRVLWTTTFKNRATHSPVFARGLLIVPTDESLEFIDPASGHSRISWNPGLGVSASPLLVGSHLYVLSNAGHVYSLRLSGNSG